MKLSATFMRIQNYLIHNSNIEGNKLKSEQLSFLEPVEPIEKNYDATICSRCCCNKCRYSVEIYPYLSAEECKENQATYQFNQKRQEVIQNILNKHKNTYDKENFQDVLDIFLRNN